MGGQVSRTDFEWVYTDQPHAARRKEILRKHPEIKELMGNDVRLAWMVVGMVLAQCLACYMIRDAPWPVIIALAYFFGGVVNHACMMAIHEISHNIPFGHHRPLANRLIGILANIPIGIPMSIAFKKYHKDHHTYLNDGRLDVDVATYWEGQIFRTTFTKMIWILLQPAFYPLRPLVIYPKPLSTLEVINIIVQITFDLILLFTMGYKSLLYLFLGTFLVMGLHPVAGHFISEHYMWKKGYDTFSYYGPLNYVTLNVGYHMEHHDFPYVSGFRLPLIRKIASEFYDVLPHHNSWTKVLYEFITSPEMGPFARTRRNYPYNPREVGVNGKKETNGQIANGHAKARMDGYPEDLINGGSESLTNGHAKPVANGSAKVVANGKKKA